QDMLVEDERVGELGLEVLERQVDIQFRRVRAKHRPDTFGVACNGLPDHRLTLKSCGVRQSATCPSRKAMSSTSRTWRAAGRRATQPRFARSSTPRAAVSAS